MSKLNILTKKTKPNKKEMIENLGSLLIPR